MKVVSGSTATDFITFEGTTINTCVDKRIIINEVSLTVGCEMTIQIPAGDQRTVFCPIPEVYNVCKKAPIGVRFVVQNGDLITNSVVQANKVQHDG